MVFLRAKLAVLCASTATLAVLGSPTIYPAPSIVTLDEGTFVGTLNGSVNTFLGIPFAQPPIGDLRFRLPQLISPYPAETYNATAFGLSCYQQGGGNQTIPSGLPEATLEALALASGPSPPFGEDCLTLNVIAPANATPDSMLPVVVWIYGGGFEGGGTIFYDGTVIVNRSIELNEPVIYVSMNYRLSAFGFLASQEVKDAGVGNLGMQDQRMALRWIQKYICSFGGDPSKVTLWGQSSGSMSVAMHMLVNGGDTEGLFRAAFMESGSPIPVGDITRGQQEYDALVELTGCSSSSDTLSCLREAPYESLQTALDTSPIFSQVTFTWYPRADGQFLVDDSQTLIQKGAIARIPFVTGDCDDEGTFFSLAETNITTDEELREFLSGSFFINYTDTEIDEVLTLYPQNVTLGSPYDTGTQNAFTPEFKRIASIWGDLVMQAPRRFFLDHTSGKQDTWSFLSKRFKSLPILGATHGSDVLNIYGPGDLTDYLIHFATNLDPNGESSVQWPQYKTSSRKLLTFVDNPVKNVTITQDTYRTEGIDFLTKLLIAHPL